MFGLDGVVYAFDGIQIGRQEVGKVLDSERPETAKDRPVAGICVDWVSELGQKHVRRRVENFKVAGVGQVWYVVTSQWPTERRLWRHSFAESLDGPDVVLIVFLIW